MYIALGTRLPHLEEAGLSQVPFDHLAEDYDRTYAMTRVGLLQRAQVWHHIDRLWHPGQQVLELGCGTGIDAEYLARRGVGVLATDSSVRMIEQAARRCRFTDLVRTRVLAAENVAAVDGQFNGVFSNFAALNCVVDLDRFACALAPRVVPGSPVVVCLFGRSCLWEMAGYLGRGQPRRALRRWRPGTVRVSIGTGAEVLVVYHDRGQVVRAFAPWFRLEAMLGIGFAVPPTYLHGPVERWPRWFELGSRLDQRLARYWPVNRLADHVLYILQRV
ncbi:MAG: methyltransferase domain-containing protein [Gemmatimonadaceae bacterium]|nr:methyltransferase domain-containing protein [Gloeobacterales cyanobacterium ES-bin-141]